MREIIRSKIVDSLKAPVPTLTRRDIHVPRIEGKAIAVIGMRRAGKTTFMWQTLSDRLAQGFPRESLLYFNFEDERLAGMSAADLGFLVDEYFQLHPGIRDGSRAVFLLDEIQIVTEWEKFARRLLDTENVDLFLSGSSAARLSREVATSMRGRAMEALVHPFSFREYLRHAGSELDTTPDRLPKAGRSALEKHLRTYLKHGGFPEAQGADSRDRRDLLRSYIDVALLRDVVERHGVSQPVALRWMVRQLLSNAGGSFSISKFYRDLKSQGFRIRKDTLHEYLAYLQDAFIVRAVSVATDSERRRMVNPRKAYPVDPGIVALFDSSSSGQVGHCLETCVLLELERRGAEIAYAKTANGFEVDFLARYPDGKAELLQVCANLDDTATRERELRALLDAKGEHRQASLHLIVLDMPVVLDAPTNITVHSASDWFLS